MRKSSLYPHSPIKSRLTIQRQLILNILKKDYSHPTAENVYAKVKEKMPRVSLATIYRNLHFLVQINMAREITCFLIPNTSILQV